MANATLAQVEALERARNGSSTANLGAIFEGFIAKGVPFADILPRVNVLTFNAWKAEGRHVRKGEHGVKVTTWIDMTDARTGERFRRPKTTTVFHVSQTDPVQ